MSQYAHLIPDGALDHFPGGRVLTCTVCRWNVQVFEAAQGATSDLEHQWIVPADYVCGKCLETAGVLTEAA